MVHLNVLFRRDDGRCRTKQYIANAQIIQRCVRACSKQIAPTLAQYWAVFGTIFSYHFFHFLFMFLPFLFLLTFWANTGTPPPHTKYMNIIFLVVHECFFKVHEHLFKTHYFLSHEYFFCKRRDILIWD